MIFEALVLLACSPILLLFFCWYPPSKRIRSLFGLHIVITGGSSGIGKELAVEAVRRKANVTIVARNQAKLEKARVEIEACRQLKEQRIQVFSADVTNYEQIDNVLKQIGPIDILVNCAGMAKSELFEKNLSTFKKLMDLNYFGSVNATFSVIPNMKLRCSGHIVFVSSMAGQLGVFGLAGYSASKFALRGLAESLLMEIRPYGIGVSVACPPDTDTPGLEEENKDKLEETSLISEAAGVFSPSIVAKDILDGVQKGKFLISSGFDGFCLNILTCGASPASSRIELFIQACLIGLIRLVMTYYTNTHHRIAKEGKEKRMRLVEEAKKEKDH